MKANRLDSDYATVGRGYVVSFPSSAEMLVQRSRVKPFTTALGLGTIIHHEAVPLVNSRKG